MGLLLHLNMSYKKINIVNYTNKLKPISIRLPPELIADLKVLAKEKGFPGYQRLIKDTLHSYVKEYNNERLTD